jgi:hypothetical protein
MHPTEASILVIAAGDYDDYLRLYADSVRDFGYPVVIGFGHEMNAPWYSWGFEHVPASTFVAACRHIVTLFRAERADNVTWLWTLQGTVLGGVAFWCPAPSRSPGSASMATTTDSDTFACYRLRHRRRRLWPDHRPGLGIDQRAGTAVRDRSRARRPP